jgi:hypothetical protein
MKKTDWGANHQSPATEDTLFKKTNATARSGSVSPLAEQLNKPTDHLSGYPPFHPYHNGLATEKGKWPT